MLIQTILKFFQNAISAHKIVFTILDTLFNLTYFRIKMYIYLRKVISIFKNVCMNLNDVVTIIVTINFKLKRITFSLKKEY